MARRLKVFAVSFLLACLFSFSASAEFSSTDSSNLSFIRSDVSTIRTYISNLSQLGLIESWLESISNNFISYFDPSRYTSFSYQALSKLDSIISSFSTSNSSLSYISSQLQSILNLLGISDKDFNTDNAFYCFDSFHYNGPTDSSFPGMIQGSNSLVVFQNTGGRYFNTFLPAGRYYINVNLANRGSGAAPVIFRFETNMGTPLDVPMSAMVTHLYDNVKRYAGYFDVTNPDGFYFGDCYILTDHPNPLGNAYLFLVEGYESVVSSSMTPSIDSSNSNLSDGVNQLEGLENQVFGSLDTSLGSIDFSGSALGQVVSGFNFIRVVFSAIYSSSSYISVLINLSCMFGVLALFLRVQPRFSRWEREHRDRSD